MVEPEGSMGLSGSLLMVAGEPSGDRHGADLARVLKESLPGIRLWGMGGAHMRGAGVDLLVDISGVSVVGIMEVASRLGAILRARRRLLRAVDGIPPTLAVLIDFPDFNLWLARALRRRGIPILYYIAPQAWAWRRGRVRLMARIVKRLAVILPFEEEFFRAGGVPATYVGHPLLEQLQVEGSCAEARRALGLAPDMKVLGLLPGSRPIEVARMLPVMLEAARRMTQKVPKLRPVVAISPAIDMDGMGIPVRELCPAAQMVRGQAHRVLRASEVAAVASGTATLEAALLGTPTVVVYRASWLSYALARALVRVKHVSLVNLLAGQEVVPELIQARFTAQGLELELLSLLEDTERKERMRAAMGMLAERLGPHRASHNVAAMAREMLLEQSLGSQGRPEQRRRV